MAACKLAAKGHTMADASYESEVQNFKTLLNLQRSSAGASGWFICWFLVTIINQIT